MNTLNWPGNDYWPQWQRILFRFVFVYFMLYMAPWTWIEYIPGLGSIAAYYYQFADWFTNWANSHLFHTYKELVPLNGSGDTSFAWVQLRLFLLITLIACVIWSLADRKNNHYNRIAWWFRNFARYYLILFCFSYGIVKLFHQQMPFPGTSLMATQLGDLLPMRLSWIYMGASETYEFFSGAMEVLAGILLLFRRTATAGTLLAAGVFANVAIMNLSYDIPVKLFSTHLFILCLVLLAFEYKRLLHFFTNKATAAGNLYVVQFPKKWMRITRAVVKPAFVVLTFGMGFYESFGGSPAPATEKAPFKEGLYDVTVFVKNRDTIPALVTDTLRWKDVVFDNSRGGSINTTDTMFWQRYRRGYFRYKVNAAKDSIAFSRSSWTMDNTDLFQLQYSMPDSNTIQLKGMIRSDSVFAVLKKSNRHFQLSEKQFHWLSEYNR